MADLRALLDAATDLDTGDFAESAQVVRDAASELAERRREPVASAGSTMAERLDRCRDRASRIVAADIACGVEYDDTTQSTGQWKIAHEIEVLAHALLAAERAPKATDHG